MPPRLVKCADLKPICDGNLWNSSTTTWKNIVENWLNDTGKKKESNKGAKGKKKEAELAKVSTSGKTAKTTKETTTAKGTVGNKGKQTAKKIVEKMKKTALLKCTASSVLKHLDIAAHSEVVKAVSTTTQKTLYKQELYYEEQELTPLMATIKKALKGQSLISTSLGVISMMIMRCGIDFMKYMSTQELPKVLLTAEVWEINIIMAYRKTLLLDGPTKTVCAVLTKVLDLFMEIMIINSKLMVQQFIWPDKFVDSSTDALINLHPFTIIQWGEEL